MDEPEVAAVGDAMGDLGPARQDDSDPQPPGDEVDRRLVGAEPGDAVEVDSRGRAIGLSRGERARRGRCRARSRPASMPGGAWIAWRPSLATSTAGSRASPRIHRHRSPRAPRSSSSRRARPPTGRRRRRPRVRMNPPASIGTSNGGNSAATEGRITPGRTSTMFGAARRSPRRRRRAGSRRTSSSRRIAVIPSWRIAGISCPCELMTASTPALASQPDARPVGPEPADEVDVDRHELAGVVDPAERPGRSARPFPRRTKTTGARLASAASRLSSAVIAAQHGLRRYGR